MHEDWATTEMKGAQLGDQRQVKSVIRICAAVAAQPALSLSAACGPAVRQAAHRIFEHDDTTVEGLLAGHFAATAARAAALPLVLIAQDTTAFVYGQSQIVGLAPINQNPKAHALYGHSALAMTPGGTPLGLWHLSLWGATAADQSRAAGRQRAREDKASWKWFAGLEAIAAQLPTDCDGVLIQDREGDIFDFLAHERPPRLQLLLRAAQDRRVAYEVATPAVSAAETRTERGLLFAVAAGAPLLGTCRVAVAGKAAAGGKPAPPAREAELALRVTEVRVQRPHKHTAATQAEVVVWLLDATEVHPPEGVEPLHWVLLTTLPLPDREAACRVLGYYSRRWLIERLHYTLKSGLGAEKLQIDDATSLAHALALYYVAAWRLLHLTHTAREHPAAPAATVLAAGELEVLAAFVGKPLRTAADAVLAVARLGGYEHYQNAPPPGVKTLWQGQIRLDGMRIGWQLARASPNQRSEL